MGRYNDEDDGNYTEYTLTMRRYQNHDTVNDVSSTFRSDDEDLEEILEHTSYFLQGCSFTYVKGLITDKESS
tara:strand:+ start:388 stop:603 length:216 start_codon:yes stop_codon:yes gene_type:complete